MAACGIDLNSILTLVRPYARHLLDRHPTTLLKKHIESTSKKRGWSTEMEEDVVIAALAAGVLSLSWCPTAFRYMRLVWMAVLLFNLVPSSAEDVQSFDWSRVKKEVTALQRVWHLGVPVAQAAQLVLSPSPRVEVYLLLLQLLSVDPVVRGSVHKMCMVVSRAFDLHESMQCASTEGAIKPCPSSAPTATKAPWPSARDVVHEERVLKGSTHIGGKEVEAVRATATGAHQKSPSPAKQEDDDGFVLVSWDGDGQLSSNAIRPSDPPTSLRSPTLPTASVSSGANSRSNSFTRQRKARKV